MQTRPWQCPFSDLHPPHLWQTTALTMGHDGPTVVACPGLDGSEVTR